MRRQGTLRGPCRRRQLRQETKKPSQAATKTRHLAPIRRQTHPGSPGRTIQVSTTGGHLAELTLPPDTENNHHGGQTLAGESMHSPHGAGELPPPRRKERESPPNGGSGRRNSAVNGIFRGDSSSQGPSLLSLLSPDPSPRNYTTVARMATTTDSSCYMLFCSSSTLPRESAARSGLPGPHDQERDSWQPPSAPLPTNWSATVKMTPYHPKKSSSDAQSVGGHSVPPKLPPPTESAGKRRKPPTARSSGRGKERRSWPTLEDQTRGPRSLKVSMQSQHQPQSVIPSCL